MTGGIANAVDPATVHQPEALTKPLMLLEMGKRMYSRFVKMVGGEEAIAALLERKIGLHILPRCGRRARPLSRARLVGAGIEQRPSSSRSSSSSTTLDEIMNAMPQVAAPQVRYG